MLFSLDIFWYNILLSNVSRGETKRSTILLQLGEEIFDLICSYWLHQNALWSPFNLQREIERKIERERGQVDVFGPIRRCVWERGGNLFVSHSVSQTYSEYKRFLPKLAKASSRECSLTMGGQLWLRFKLKRWTIYNFPVSMTLAS